MIDPTELRSEEIVAMTATGELLVALYLQSQIVGGGYSKTFVEQIVPQLDRFANRAPIIARYISQHVQQNARP